MGKMVIRWRALHRRATDNYGEVSHAVPLGSTRAICGAIARGIDGKSWVDNVHGMKHHKDCERAVSSIIRQGWCPVAGKKRFATEIDANIVLANAKMRVALYGDKRRREERKYPCPHCQGWHVTSRI